jgi:serine protease Do
VGIAHHYPEQRTMVVTTEVGGFAVVVGPYRAKTVSQLEQKFPELPPFPRDARMSRGDDFVATVWTAEEDSKRGLPVPLQAVKLGKNKRLEASGVSLAVNYVKQKGGNLLHVSGRDKDGQTFNFEIAKADALIGGEAMFGLYRVDKTTALPQVVITAYSGGAHCCTQTWVLSKPDKAADWGLVDLGARDGDGFALEDVDGDGVWEMIASDDAFLYSFDSYANSYAPVVYWQMSGDRLVDISTTLPVRSELERDLAYIEFDAKTDPERWKSNGFLAAWVASKIRLGQGEDAWTVMLENFSHDARGSVLDCDPDLADCETTQSSAKVSFPKALARFLQETGYGPLPITALSSVQ